MNPFLSLLHTFIDPLPEKTPEARADVYRRARDEIIKQMQAMTPPLNEGQIEEKVEKFRQAILVIEQEYHDEHQVGP